MKDFISCVVIAVQTTRTDRTNKIKNLDKKSDACVSCKLYTRIVASSQNRCCLMQPITMYTFNSVHLLSAGRR